MKFSTQRRIAAQLLKVGVNRIVFDQDRLNDIKEAITKVDLRSLIQEKAIKVKPVKGNSRYRVRETIRQKRKGRRRDIGSRRGKATARLKPKKVWMNKIRAQRNLIAILKDKKLVTTQTYRILRKRAKGGFFRSKAHIKLYLKTNNLIQNGKK